ncbi:MAG TPA: hypothetical protein VEG24_09890 [Gaiellaceae bacterium]|nr:hypothetical protein [Gaiellaceae bacterium]
MQSITERSRRSVQRVVFRGLYVVAVATGVASARLARSFHALRLHSRTYGQVVILLQLPVLAAWLPLRVAFLASSAACMSLAY